MSDRYDNLVVAACPFCGSNMIRRYQLHHHCLACKARGPKCRGTKLVAVQLWNQRSDAKRIALAVLDELGVGDSLGRVMRGTIEKLCKRIEAGDVLGLER